MRELYQKNKRIKDNRRKIFLFFLMIALSLAITFRTGYTDIYANGVWNLNDYPMLLTGIAISPFASFLFIRKNTTYNACILLIFLSATALMCASFCNESPFLSHLGHVAVGMLIPSIIIILPLLTFYLLGPIDYFFNVCKGYLFVTGGVIMYFPLKQVPQDGDSMQVLITFAFFVLTVSFFTVFSAWNHRLVLLK